MGLGHDRLAARPLSVVMLGVLGWFFNAFSVPFCRHALGPTVCRFLSSSSVSLWAQRVGHFLSPSVVTLWAHSVSFSVLFCHHALGPQCVVFCPLLPSRFGPTVCRFLSPSVVTLWAHSVTFSVLFCRHALGPQCVVFCPLLSSHFGNEQLVMTLSVASHNIVCS